MTRYFFLACSVLPFLIPLLVFVVVGVMAGMSIPELTLAAGSRLTASRQNLLVIGLTGLFPVLLLWLTLWLYRRFGGDEGCRRWMGWAGLGSIALVLLWVNAQFWPLFLPSQTYPGFPHGLEFVIGPGLFAPIAMALSMLAAFGLFRSSLKSGGG